jgi:rod shape-determining protein MreB
MNTLIEPEITNRIILPDELDDKKGPRTKTRNNGHHSESSETVEDKKALLLGFDWGTHTSCIQGAYPTSADTTLTHIVPTVVGYAKEGIVADLLPGNARVLFGQEALQHRLHLRLVAPMTDGVVEDLPASRDFASHIRSLIDAPEGTELRAVIGVPANASGSARENMRQAVAGLFDRVILIPEPFLAALGYRDEAKLGSAGYVDPVKNSLYVDIGAGTTDVCLVQGYYPTADDQISLSFAGEKVDALLSEAIKKTYPDCDLPLSKVREIKEQYSYVGKPPEPCLVNIIVGGKMRKLELTEQIGYACGALLTRLLAAVKTLIARASYDSVAELLQNIILAGGGSRIRNLDTELQRLLTEEGFEQPSVKVVGKNYKEFVARGALKAARQARENQWQQLLR